MSDDRSDRIIIAIGKLSEVLDKIVGGVERLHGTMGQVEDRLDRLDDRQDKTRTAIMERIDRMQHTLDQARDEIIVNFGNTDRAERAARSAIDDTRITTDILRTMQRQIARLQTDVEQLKGPPEAT